MTKICLKCGEEKDLNQFSPRKDRGPHARQPHCKECKTVAARERRKLDPAHYRGIERKYRRNNSEKQRQKSRTQYRNNRQYYLNYSKKYIDSHRESYRIHWKGRHSSVRKATPPWITAKQRDLMKSIYVIADILTKETGTQYHVGHIHPLRGKTVCGLHVPWNLRVIPAKENMIKKNKLIHA